MNTTVNNSSGSSGGNNRQRAATRRTVTTTSITTYATITLLLCSIALVINIFHGHHMLHKHHIQMIRGGEGSNNSDNKEIGSFFDSLKKEANELLVESGIAKKTKTIHLKPAKKIPESFIVHKKNKDSGETEGSINRQQHKLAGLSCDAFHTGIKTDLNISSNVATNEMVYWKDIPNDSKFISPFHQGSSSIGSSKQQSSQNNNVQYLTFEPDGGGFNNIRMAMETILVLAISMGRTLVLPPQQRMYLLNKQKKDGSNSKESFNEKKEFGFNDFFHMDLISKEYPGLNIITMEEFLMKEGMTGNLHYESTPGEVSYPPNNRTNWDGMTNDIKTILNPWLRDVVGYIPEKWNPENCLAIFPESDHESNVVTIQNTFNELLNELGIGNDNSNNNKLKDLWKDYVNKPTPVNASLKERLRENLAGRKEICIYDKTLQSKRILHFSGKKNVPGGRLLVHFYAFTMYQNYHDDLIIKRFIRDHVRYNNLIQCCAAIIVNAIRKHVRNKYNKLNGNIYKQDKEEEMMLSTFDDKFDTFHIRRGDFQYKKTKISADEIYDISKDVIKKGTTVYIATDERNKDFFINSKLSKNYDLLFLDDFIHLLPSNLNPNYYGMIDQLIASKGYNFFGCWFSTFTSYITRLRGYHSNNNMLDGYKMGILNNTYYYALKENKYKMKSYYPIKKAFYSREYPISWRDIDHNV